MGRIEITEAELLAAFNDALGDVETEDGHTASEIAEIMGWGCEKIRVAMRTLILAGSWEAIQIKRESPLRPGVSSPVCGYRPVRSD